MVDLKKMASLMKKVTVNTLPTPVSPSKPVEPHQIRLHDLRVLLRHVHGQDVADVDPDDLQPEGAAAVEEREDLREGPRRGDAVQQAVVVAGLRAVVGNDQLEEDCIQCQRM